MIFLSERAADRRNKATAWQLVFAWLPVFVGPYQIAWLTKVERRTYVAFYGAAGPVTEHRIPK